MNSDDLKKQQSEMRGRATDRPEKKKRPYVPRHKTRRQAWELKEIKRAQQQIIESLKGADDIQSKRLLWDILDRERDRIEGRPAVAEPPAKPSAPGNSKLQADIQNLFTGGETRDSGEPRKPWGARLKQRQALAARDRDSEAQSSPESSSEESDEDQATQ
jgi:hypothetical protein